MSEPSVRQERSGWRDLALNNRHRQWGWNCPAVDLDLLFVEYDQGRATAIVEYKHEDAQPMRSWHPSYQALIDLGNRAGIPVFCCRYAEDFSWWRVSPLNDHARQHLQEPDELTEEQWVRFLYFLRGRELPRELFAAGTEML